MPRDPQRPESLYLADIVDSARTIQEWLIKHGSQWIEDDVVSNAVLYKLTIVGEAAGCLSADTVARIPAVPWRAVRGFRNHVVHGYFGVDWALVRETAELRLPDMAEQVMAFLRTEYPQVALALDLPVEGGG
jgi:uncharacterized protein with HEPN domain